MTPTRREYRCPKCGRLLFVGAFLGWIELPCGKCKRIRRIEQD